MSGFGRIGERIQAGSLYVLLFLLPFSKAAIEIAFGVLLLGWVMMRLDPVTRADSVWKSPCLRGLLVAIGGYVIICALSITISSDPLLSVRGLVRKWLEYIVFFLIIADLGRRSRILNRGLSVVAWSSFFVVIEALAQGVFGKGLFRGYQLYVFGRITGPYENPGDLATYLIVVIPILFMWMRTRVGLSRVALRGLLLCLVVCLAETESVGAWVAICVGLLILVVFNASVRRIVVVMFMGGILLGGFALYRQGDLADVISLSDIGKVDRLVMWQAAWGMISDRPVLGHGLNTFMANYLDYWVGGQYAPRYAHNCYLQIAAETGIMGLLAFLGLLALFFKRLFKSLRRIRGSDHILLVGLTGGLVAFAVHAGIDTNFYSLRQAVLFWVISGLALGMAVRVNTGITTSQESPASVS